jgi:hypothetical protein
VLFLQPRYWCARAVLRLALFFACATVALSTTAAADGFTQRDSFGEAGLLDMPGARMAPDGEIALTLSGMDNVGRGTLSLQILPWLEGSFRYTRIGRWTHSPDYDRSFGLKLRLFEEDTYTPDISVGLRDIVGTGIYGGEYIAATKRFFDFDVTAGLGWGRLASNGTFENPLAQIFSSFEKRTRNGTEGGQVDFGSFFHGPDMGAFGGVVWHTPIDNLNLTLEYSSDRYVQERAFGGFKGTSPLNVGLTYQPISGVTFTAGWFYGYSFGAGLTLSANPSEPSTAGKIGTPPMPVNVRSDVQRAEAVADFVTRESVVQHLGGGIEHAEIMDRILLVDVRARGHARKYCDIYRSVAAAYRTRIDSVAVTDLDDAKGKIVFCAVGRNPIVEAAYTISADANSGAPKQKPARFDASAAGAKIRTDAKAQGLRVEALAIGPQELTLYYTNHRYQFESEAIGRLVRVLLADAPPSVEAFHLVPMVSGVPAQDVYLLRAPLERMFDARGAPSEIGEAISLSAPPLGNPAVDDSQSGTYPRFSWAVSPSLRQGLFDPQSPYRIQAYLAMWGAVDVRPGLSLEGAFEANIYNTFTTKRASDSVLPHVRSDLAEYLTKGENGVAALDAVWRARAAPDVFVEAKAGYLESMFAGAGAQVLWRPEGERWALGADIYEVWQRDFDRLFAVQHYHVLTGHLSLYYRSPWHGIGVNLHAGRYLAGDYGATVEVMRRFATGVEIGAFATFTNVPFEKFGEGSFDKGIMISIPFEWALPLSTQSSYNVTLRPLTRDGGQRLDGDDSLYGETQRTSYGEITEHEDAIANP